MTRYLRTFVCLTATLLLGLLPLELSAHADTDAPSFFGRTNEDSISIDAVISLDRNPELPSQENGLPIRAGESGNRREPSNTSSESSIRHWRATPHLCQLADLAGASPVLRAECDSEGQRLARQGPECGPDLVAQGALFEQRRSGESWTAPLLIEEDSCVDPTEPAEDEQVSEQERQVDIPAAAARAFQDMTIEPSALTVQPPSGWTLVNLDTIAYTNDEPRVLDTNLFGIPVSIRAVPDSYAWNWGDGASSTGVDPGAPYPHHTIAHAYSTPGTATITLTTTWRGQFRLPGDPAWRDVPGQATTTSQAPPIEIREARTRLVEDLSR